MVSPWAHSAHRLGLATLAVGLLATAGCNNGRQLQADLYQRELRLQEDEIYRLEDYVSEYQEIIRGYRCELAETHRKLSQRGNGSPDPSGDGGPTLETLPRPTPADLPETPDPIDLGPVPEIETTLPTDPGDAAPAFGEPADEAPPFQPTSAIEADGDDGATLARLDVVEQPAPAGPPNPYPHAADEKPLAALAVAGVKTDASLRVRAAPGDTPGTLVAAVEESRSASLAGFLGEASVMLVDPAESGRFRRLARWDFTAEEVMRSWRDDADGTRLALPVALPDGAPTEHPLVLWVRLIDNRGEKRLQACEVRFEGSPPELADRRLAQAGPPRRLPATDTPTEPALLRLAGGEAQPLEGWRPATSRAASRRRDAAVTTASFHEE